MKRIVLLVISLGLLGLGIFIPAFSWADNSVEAATAVSSGDSSDPTTITDYKADFDLADDGDLSVVETLTVAFPTFPERHGIFRFWDRVDNTPSTPAASCRTSRSPSTAGPSTTRCRSRTAVSTSPRSARPT